MNAIAAAHLPPRTVTATNEQGATGWNRRRGARPAVRRIAHGRGLHDDDRNRLIAAQHLRDAETSGAGSESPECQQQHTPPLRTYGHREPQRNPAHRGRYSPLRRRPPTHAQQPLGDGIWSGQEVARAHDRRITRRKARGARPCGRRFAVGTCPIQRGAQVVPMRGVARIGGGTGGKGIGGGAQGARLVQRLRAR